jgi:hypothetical protein
MQEVIVNYWAVLACAVASMVLGFLWYGPLFGKAWMKAMGMNPNMSREEIKAKQAKATPGYVAMFISSLVMAYVLKHMLTYAGAETVSDGLMGAAWIWVGFVATIGLAARFFEERPWSYYFINRGYDLVNLLVFSVLLMTIQ